MDCMLITLLLCSFGLPLMQEPDSIGMFKVDTSSVQTVVIIPEVADTLDTVPVVEEPAVMLSDDGVVESLGSAPDSPRVVTHLKFKDIPIDGGVAAFGKKLEELGYKPSSSSSYNGTFAGVDNVRVVPYNITGLVWKVSVLFPIQKFWIPMKEQYFKFKDWFAWKYVAKPTYVREQLSARFKEGTGQEAWGFESGAAVYKTVYDIPDGRVVMYITYDAPSGGMRLCMEYIDRINSILKEENDMLDL